MGRQVGVKSNPHDDPCNYHKVDELRASWTMAKEAAGFEVHGPAIFRM